MHLHRNAIGGIVPLRAVSTQKFDGTQWEVSADECRRKPRLKRLRLHHLIAAEEDAMRPHRRECRL